MSQQVPPIIVAMLRQKELCAKYDLSSVKGVYTGAAPLGIETAEELQAAYPKIDVLQGYGRLTCIHHDCCFTDIIDRND